MENTTNRLFTLLNVFCFSRNHAIFGSARSENRYTYYARLLIFAFLYATVVIYRDLYQTTRLTKGAVANAVEFVNYYSRIPITFITVILMNLSTAKLHNFFNGISRTNSRITAMGFNVPYTEYCRRIKLFYFITLLKVLAQQIPNLVAYPTFPVLLNHFVIAFSSTTLYLTNFLWVSCILLLDNSFKALNETLKTLKYSQCWVVEDYKKSARSNEVSSELLKKCAALYSVLCVLCKDINCVFSWIVLLDVPMLFVGIIFDTFTVCHMIQRIVVYDGKFVVYDIIGVVSFLEIVVPCILLKEESDKFCNSLNKLDLDFREDAELEMTSNSLALQMYHQKVNLTALDIFPLDGTLVYSIFGAVTTYLVILLQFD